jgi:hypothetical protein
MGDTKKGVKTKKIEGSELERDEKARTKMMKRGGVSIVKIIFWEASRH